MTDMLPFEVPCKIDMSMPPVGTIHTNAVAEVIDAREWRTDADRAELIVDWVLKCNGEAMPEALKDRIVEPIDIEEKIAQMHLDRKRMHKMSDLPVALLYPSEKNLPDPIIYNAGANESDRMTACRSALVRTSAGPERCDGYSGGGRIEINNEHICDYYSDDNGSHARGNHKDDAQLFANALDDIIQAYHIGNLTMIPNTIHINIVDHVWVRRYSGTCVLQSSIQDDIAIIERLMKVASENDIGVEELAKLKQLLQKRIRP